jgi:cell division protein FtsB
MDCPFKFNCLVYQHISTQVNNLEQLKKENEALKKEIMAMKGQAVENNKPLERTEELKK